MERDNRFSRLRVNRGKRNWADNIDCAALMFYWIRSLAAALSLEREPALDQERNRFATDSFPSHGQKRAKRETTSLGNRFHPCFYSRFFLLLVFPSMHIYIYISSSSRNTLGWRFARVSCQDGAFNASHSTKKMGEISKTRIIRRNNWESDSLQF